MQADPMKYYNSWNIGRAFKKALPFLGITFLGIAVISAFLMPIGYMTLTAFKTLIQIQDVNSRWLPSSPETFNYQGTEYPIYKVPTEGGVQELALVKKMRRTSKEGTTTYESTFVDPSNPDKGLIVLPLNWFTLESVYYINPTTANFPAAWAQINLGLLFRNTFFIAIMGTIGTLISSTLVAYGFARFRVPGIDTMFLVLMATIILPSQITIIPQYIFFRSIGWGGTMWPLIIPHFFANAYNVFLLRQFFKSIPRELDEAAAIDGASPLGTLLYILLPQSGPALTAVGMFHFFWAWNDFFTPLIYLQGNPELYTISIGMTQFNNIFNTQPGYAMAASMMAVALPVIVFFLAQRAFMQGIVITGIEK